MSVSPNKLKPWAWGISVSLCVRHSVGVKNLALELGLLCSHPSFTCVSFVTLGKPSFLSHRARVIVIPTSQGY